MVFFVVETEEGTMVTPVNKNYGYSIERAIKHNKPSFDIRRFDGAMIKSVEVTGSVYLMSSEGKYLLTKNQEDLAAV